MSEQLDPKFEELVKGVVKVEKKIAEAAQKQGEAKPWMNYASDDIPAAQRPESKSEEDLNKKTFDRTKSNSDYVDARKKDDAKAKEVAIPKLTGDYLGACVRDKRMQWRSRIRQIAHGFATVAGSGEDAGPLRRNTVDYLQRIFMKATEEKKSVS